MMNENLALRRCNLCGREHYVDVRQTLASADCFTGLMGSTEMECALAVIVNKARRNGCQVERVVVEEKDFPGEHSYERDGFRDMIDHGWLVHFEGNGWYPDPLLVKRLHKRIPNA